MSRPALINDWYRVETIAPGVFAIGDPRYAQLNWSYLIVGERRAIMFDTGPGERDIRPVAGVLAAKPITALASHLHYDHIGNLKSFAHVAFADLPLLRGFEHDGLIHAPLDHVLGANENRFWTPVVANEWLPLNRAIDLGGLAFSLLHTPGHSPESVSLHIPALNILLAADFVYPGELYGQVPNANLPDYLAAAQQIYGVIADDTIILCGHGESPQSAAPRLARKDIHDLIGGLAKIRDRKLRPVSATPFTFPISDRLTLLASEASFGTWQIPSDNI